MSDAPAPLFEALIVPYRSLGRRGVTMVMAALGAVSAGLALRFWMWGAWPVLAFCAVELPIVAVLLIMNLQRARASELLLLNSQEMTVVRTDHRGRREQMCLPAAWLRVDLESPDEIPRVMLRSYGRDCEVGAFLHAPEKVSLFEALRDALYEARNPRFDNPQLRGE